MTRRANDFRSMAEAKGITRWIVHQCSLCDYACAFVFSQAPGMPEVYYDSGCDCVVDYLPLQLRSWQDVAEHYNGQTDPRVIMEMDLFWGFKQKK